MQEIIKNHYEELPELFSGLSFWMLAIGVIMALVQFVLNGTIVSVTAVWCGIFTAATVITAAWYMYTAVLLAKYNALLSEAKEDYYDLLDVSLDEFIN